MKITRSRVRLPPQKASVIISDGRTDEGDHFVTYFLRSHDGLDHPEGEAALTMSDEESTDLAARILAARFRVPPEERSVFIRRIHAMAHDFALSLGGKE